MTAKKRTPRKPKLMRSWHHYEVTLTVSPVAKGLLDGDWTFEKPKRRSQGPSKG